MLNVFLIHALCRAIALWASPVPTKWCDLCVTESRPLMQRCGPGANVRPHDWMAPCAVFISQKGPRLSALTSHSAPLWLYDHAHLRYLHKEELCNLRIQITVRKLLWGKTLSLLLYRKLNFQLSAVCTWHGMRYASSSFCLQKQRHVPLFITNHASEILHGIIQHEHHNVKMPWLYGNKKNKRITWYKIFNLRYVLCQKRIALYDRCLQTTLGNTCIILTHLG